MGNKCHLRILTQFFTSLSLEQHGRSICLCPWKVLQVPLEDSSVCIVSLLSKQSNDKIMKASSCHNISKFFLYNTKSILLIIQILLIILFRFLTIILIYVFDFHKEIAFITDGGILEYIYSASFKKPTKSISLYN